MQHKLGPPRWTSEDITESKIDENFSDQERRSGSETSQNEMTEPTMEQGVETEKQTNISGRIIRKRSNYHRKSFHFSSP